MGIRDEGGLEHGIDRLLYCLENHGNDQLYVASIAYEIFAKRHYFVDGNKRTAHVIAKIILLAGRYHFKPHYKDAVPFILEIAQEGKKSFQEIYNWIRENSKPLEGNIEQYIRDFSSDMKEIADYQDGHA